MNIQAIGFDYGGVIGGGGKLGKRFTQTMCEILEISKEEYDQVYFSHNHLINTGKVATWKEFWTIVLKLWGKSDKLDEVMNYSNSISSDYAAFDQKILALISTLRSHHLKTGLLSNATIENGKALRSKGLQKYFDTFYISAEVGYQKPDPKAFQLFAKNLGVSLNELVFIDDAQKSLSTAKECGYTPILYRSYEQLINELGALGVL